MLTKMIFIPLCFILAFGLSLYFVPVMRRAALKWGVVDRPDGHLKFQKKPVPYLGGIGVYVSFLLAVSLVYDFSPQVLGLLLAGTIMLMIGLVDDFGVLLPYQKLAGQLLATFVLIKAGIYIKVEYFPLWVSIPLTVFWMIGIINAINIIDIMDGLSAGVSLCACFVLMVVALVNGNATIAVLTVALAGALLGFLVYNFPPAKVYLGDAGSLFVGLMLGALAMIGEYSRENPLGYVAPVMILGLPIFDTIFVMMMRAKKKLPIFLGSQDHYAIRLKKLGLSVGQVVVLSYLFALVTGGLAILIMYLVPLYSIIILAALAFLTIAAILWLNRLED